MSESDGVKKIKYMQLQIAKKNSEDELVDILNHSEFIFSNHWNQGSFPNAFNLEIKINPDIFIKYFRGVL